MTPPVYKGIIIARYKCKTAQRSGMSQTKVTTTVELPGSKQEMRDEVYDAFDVPTDVRPVGEVFGDADRALGSQNTTTHNGVAQPKDDPCLFTTNQVPAQLINHYGPVEGATRLARSWIAHGDELAESGLRGCEKACLIDQAVEKYAFNMFVGEGAATEAVMDELGYEPAARTPEEMIDDETGSEKVDVRFTNGKTLQVKVGRAAFEKCDMKAKVEPDGKKAKVTIWEK